MVLAAKAARTVLLTMVVLALAGAARAETDGGGPSYPRLDVDIPIEVQNDGIVASDDRDNKLNDLFTTTEPTLVFSATPEISGTAHFVLEPVADPDPRQSRVFGDHGIFVEELFARYDHDYFDVYGGKYNPPFGVAWDLAPGIYGTEFAEDTYELTERIGFGGALNFGGPGIGGDGFGAHVLTGNVFFVDRSALSEALITDRGRVRLSDGGVGNHSGLKSYTITASGGGIPGIPGDLEYNIGYQLLASDQEDLEDEKGFVFGLNGSFAIDEDRDISLEPIIEFVQKWDAEGEAQNQQIITAGSALLIGPWNVSLSYSARLTDPDAPEEANISDHQFQLTGGYAFEFGLAVDLGYRWRREERVDSHTIGLLLFYPLSFSIPGVFE